MKRVAGSHSRSTKHPSDTSQPSAVPAVTPTSGQRFLGLTFSLILQFLASSWRVQVSGQHILDELAASKRRCIFAFWHRNYITLFRLLRDRPVVVVTNQSSRGQIITNICHRTGMRTIQVAEEGSIATLDLIEQATVGGEALGIAVDGPLGPAGKVKRVVPHLAKTLACPVVPISVTTHCTYALRQRWDQLEIPLPFSRVSFVIGEPIEVPKMRDRRERKAAAERIRRAIEEGEPCE